MPEMPKSELTCEKCGKEFKYTSNRNRHVERGVCGGETQCKVCLVEFKGDDDPDEHRCMFVCTST